MTKTKLAKLGITTLAAGAITLSAMTYFTGTDTIDLAKDTIVGLGEKIGIYESNEIALINKINELNAELTILRAQEDETESLMLQISELENQIEELENQLSNAENNGETLAERIILLENEVILANEKTSELQAVIDENIVEGEPLTDLELAEITGEEIEQEVVEEVVEEVEPGYIELTFTEGSGERLTIVKGLEFYYYSSYYNLTNNTGSSVNYQVGETGEVLTITNQTANKQVGSWNGLNVNLVIITLKDGQTYRINIIK